MSARKTGALEVGSLFAGIGGFDLGFERAGFTVAWHAEIDKAASRILAYHWPTVPNLGDVTKIDGAAIEPVDVICGGFPCQDLSVAGKRAGFTGKRSVLAFEFLRIVAEMREATNGSAPTFIVLENVPGLFSSSAGRDFAALLDALAELRPLDIAWRVLDSRYFNVAQRRERVFVVVDFGGERCDEILALTEGLRGDSPASRAAREDVAGTLGGGAQSRGWCDDLDRAGAFVTDDVAFPVLSREGKGPASSVDSGNIVVTHTLRADGFDASENGTGRGTPLVTVAATLSAGGHPNSNAPGRRREDDENLVVQESAVVHCACGHSERKVGTAILRSPCSGCGEIRSGEVCYDPPVGVGCDGPPVAVSFHENQRGEVTLNDTAGALAWAVAIPEIAQPLRSNGYNNSDPGMEARMHIPHSSGVRRLTPRECERLQGFPDDWTGIPGMADGPRYKCLGNAVTVNVAEWIAARVKAAERGEK